MKYLLLTALATIFLSTVAISSPAVPGGKTQDKILHSISYTEEDPELESYDWACWDYSFQYESGKITGLTYRYDNYYVYIKWEYSSQVIVESTGNNEDGEYNRTIYHIYYDRPEFCTSVSISMPWNWGDPISWHADNGGCSFAYNKEGSLVSIKGSEGEGDFFEWADGNLVNWSGKKFEYGKEKNKIGILSLAMPLIASNNSHFSLAELIVCGTNTTKNLPISVTYADENGIEVKHTFKYTFDKDGYPTCCETEDGNKYVFDYN